MEPGARRPGALLPGLENRFFEPKHSPANRRPAHRRRTRAGQSAPLARALRGRARHPRRVVSRRWRERTEEPVRAGPRQSLRLARMDGRAGPAEGRDDCSHFGPGARAAASLFGRRSGRVADRTRPRNCRRVRRGKKGGLERGASQRDGRRPGRLGPAGRAKRQRPSRSQPGLADQDRLFRQVLSRTPV